MSYASIEHFLKTRLGVAAFQALKARKMQTLHEFLRTDEEQLREFLDEETVAKAVSARLELLQMLRSVGRSRDRLRRHQLRHLSDPPASTGPDPAGSPRNRLPNAVIMTMDKSTLALLLRNGIVTQEQLLEFDTSDLRPRVRARVAAAQSTLRRYMGVAECQGGCAPSGDPARDRMVFEAILNTLSSRAVSALHRCLVHNLRSFLQLTREEVLCWTLCGHKTGEEIIAAQALADVLRSRVSVDCPGGSGADDDCPESESAGIDLENPYASFREWLSSRTHADETEWAFLLRYGMAGERPMTLREIGHALGRSGVQVRQMNQRVERLFYVDQPFLHPLVNEAASIVSWSGGSLPLSELTLCLLVRGPQGHLLRHAVPFIRLVLTAQPAAAKAGLLLNGNKVYRTQTDSR